MPSRVLAVLWRPSDGPSDGPCMRLRCMHATAASGSPMVGFVRMRHVCRMIAAAAIALQLARLLAHMVATIRGCAYNDPPGARYRR
jgi:hypothetical protein